MSFASLEDRRNYNREYRKNHREQALAASKKHYQKNKEIILEKHRQYHADNKDKESAKRKEKFDKNPEIQMYNNLKSSAKKNSKEFNLELEDIVIPEVCPILLIPIIPRSGKLHKGSPSVDRIDNSKGYIKGNIRVISQKANSHKGDLTVEEIKRLYEYVSGLV